MLNVRKAFNDGLLCHSTRLFFNILLYVYMCINGQVHIYNDFFHISASTSFKQTFLNFSCA